MKKRNGFTLIELLAVIVVLAIIMILAIPTVLDVMNNARKQSFVIAVDKYVTAVQQQYLSDSNFDVISGAGVYVYNIKTDLGLNSTGNNQGYVVVDARNKDSVKYWIIMHDNNYYIIHNVTELKLPDKNSSAILPYSGWDVANELDACHKALGTSVQCMNKRGQILA
jgi:prepilin-type N-terminal cleavage/methylation domain-containing protein